MTQQNQQIKKLQQTKTLHPLSWHVHSMRTIDIPHSLHAHTVLEGGMHYHNQQIPIHCGQRITKYRAKKRECKAFSAELKIAFDIDTSGDDVNIHPEMFCMHCKLSMQRTICAITKGVHHKCPVILFGWQKYIYRS